MIKLYYSFLSNKQELPTVKLSQYRLKRLNRLKRTINQQQGIMAEMLLIKLLETVESNIVLPLEIDVREYGKPYLANLNYYFNQSHSNKLVATALGTLELGIDVEKIDEKKMVIDRRIFEASEKHIYDSLEGQEKLEYLFKVWVAKESYFKLVGSGITSKIFELITKFDGNSFSLVRNNVTYYGQIIKVDDYYLSVITTRVADIRFECIIL